MILRTPEARFAGLPDFPFAPRYLPIPDPGLGLLRMHYVDEGPRDGNPVLLLHGQGSWSYLYRHVIPGLVARGCRAIAPDYIGFGRSDKPADEADYSFDSHLRWLRHFLDSLGLHAPTAYLFDWGGFFGLRLLGEDPGLFGRIMLTNTTLPTGRGGGRDWFLRWRAEQLALPRFPQGGMVAAGVTRPLSRSVIEAYDRPYPDERYKAGPRRFPMILPIDASDPAAVANAAAWERLATWDRPALTLFTGAFAGTHMGPERLIAHLPGARGQAHMLVPDTSFYLVEDRPDVVTRSILDFIGG